MRVLGVFNGPRVRGVGRFWTVCAVKTNKPVKLMQDIIHNYGSELTYEQQSNVGFNKLYLI